MLNDFVQEGIVLWNSLVFLWCLCYDVCSMHLPLVCSRHTYLLAGETFVAFTNILLKCSSAFPRKYWTCAMYLFARSTASDRFCSSFCNEALSGVRTPWHCSRILRQIWKTQFLTACKSWNASDDTLSCHWVISSRASITEHWSSQYHRQGY